MNTPEKKISERPADAVILPGPNAQNGEVVPLPKQTTLTPFEDGYIFKFTRHPTEPGRFVLFTSEKQPVGVIEGAPIADLICQAVKALFMAAQLREDAAAEQELAAELAESEAQHLHD